VDHPGFDAPDGDPDFAIAFGRGDVASRLCHGQGIRGDRSGGRWPTSSPSKSQKLAPVVNRMSVLDVREATANPSVAARKASCGQ
jgi:hypothetical protein